MQAMYKEKKTGLVGRYYDFYYYSTLYGRRVNACELYEAEQVEWDFDAQDWIPTDDNEGEKNE